LQFYWNIIGFKIIITSYTIFAKKKVIYHRVIFPNRKSGWLISGRKLYLLWLSAPSKIAYLCIFRSKEWIWNVPLFIIDWFIFFPWMGTVIVITGRKCSKLSRRNFRGKKYDSYVALICRRDGFKRCLFELSLRRAQQVNNYRRSWRVSVLGERTAIRIIGS